MSYIANLVHRTLGVTPVAQPVIQARFAPPISAYAPAVREASVAERLAPAPPLAHSISTPQTTRVPQPPINGAPSEGIRPWEGRGVAPTRPTVSGEPARADLAANEREPVPVPSPEHAPPRPGPRAVQAFSPESQLGVSAGWDGDDVQMDDDFRLMKDAPSRSTQNFSPAQPAYPTAALRSRETESAARPVVRVHIGRVDVRLVAPGTKEPRASTPSVPDAKPASLDEYLRARQRGNQ